MKIPMQMGGVLKPIKWGKESTKGNNITANTPYVFTVTDANIQASDMILATLFINGAGTEGVTAPRCVCSNGSATMIFLSSKTYASSVTIGFQYVILRAQA